MAIGLRILFAARPELLTQVLRIVHRVIAGFLLKQAGLKRTTADTGAVTLIQRFGSAANLNIHLHCLVLDGVYRRTGGEPVFQEARAPTGEALKGLIEKIIVRLMKGLTRLGYLVEEQGMCYLADLDPDNPLTPLQAASCTYRIALGPRRKALERLCRYITRPAIANERLKEDAAGNVVLQLKSPWRDGTTHLRMSPLEFMQRLAALVPRPRLLKRVFDIDLEHCPQCGGAFRIIAAIEAPAVIVKILTHLGLPARAPPRSPARRPELFQAA